LLIQLPRAAFDTEIHIPYKKETFVGIKELIGEEYFLDLTEFATENAIEKRPVGYRYRLVSTLDHTAEPKHYTSNCYRQVQTQKLEEYKAEAAKHGPSTEYAENSDAAESGPTTEDTDKHEETKREQGKTKHQWYEFNDLKVKKIDAKHAVTRDAAGFIFELVEDEKYD